MIQLKQYPKYQSDFKLDDSQVLKIVTKIEFEDLAKYCKSPLESSFKKK